MGYRSEVKALIYPASGDQNLLQYEQLKTLMNTTFKDVLDFWKEDYFNWLPNVRVLQFSANSVKWYDSYPEVDRFTRFLAEVQELGYEYEFIRVGEDMDDIEDDSTGDAEGYLYVQRTIEVGI
jgi:hypothetical protein